MEKRKKIYYICTLLLTALLLSSCGKKERQRGIDGFIYEAELISGTENWGSNFKSSGNWLYYMGYGPSLYRIPLTEFGGLKTAEGELVSGGEGILDYTVDTDGSVYCFRAATEWLDSGKAALAGGELTRYQESGEIVFQISLDDRKGVYSSLSSTPGFLATGGDGRVFLLSGDEILAVDKSGNIVLRADITAYRPGQDFAGTEKLLEGGEGKVYYLTESSTQRMVYELVEEGSAYRLQKMSGTGWEDKGSLIGNFFGSSQGVLYSGINGMLQCCSIQDGEWRDILCWSDSNLWQFASEVVCISEEAVLASYAVLRDGDVSTEYYLLNKKRVEEVPEKEELVLACWSVCNRDLEDAIIRFNRASDRYHIKIETYDGEDALKRLDARLVSSNAPDMLALSGLDVAKYSGKLMLEDLAEYLDKSSALEQEDFMDGVLDGYTVNGRLAGIPSGFMCYTLLGRSAEVGAEEGWKLEDVIELTKKYSGRKLNGRSFYFNLDNICGDYIMEKFIDHESGECHFDNKEFRYLIQWLKENSGSGSGYYDIDDMDDSLVDRDSISDFIDFLHYIRSNEEITLIGFPSDDGQPLYHVCNENAVGIAAKSEHKEGAWQFIEYFLSQETERTWQLSGYFPSRKDLFEKMVEYVVTPGHWYGMECATKEEEEALRNMIANTDFSAEDTLKAEIMSIIAEEADIYFAGNKTLEEVIKVMQNRVQLLLNE